jgi:uncharacterized SAM-binding protein YcdF (DUF218 family)
MQDYKEKCLTYWHIFRNARKRTKYIILLLILYPLIQILYIVGYGFIHRCPNLHDSHDVVVVLGNRVYADGTPSPVLRSRLDEAYRVSQDIYCNRTGYIIVSGGLGADGRYEGTAMAEYLTRKGYPREKIIVDDEGVNTFATAYNTKEIANTYGFSRILVVTSYYHVLRSVQAFRLAGFADKYVSGQGSRYIAWQDIFKIPRELAGIYVYWWRY